MAIKKINEFILDYEIKNLKTADYNPRKINEEAFEVLKYSIAKFGIVKPLILNGKNKILTAGHQRTKASKSIGLKTVPVIVIKESIPLHDEINFNLLHNSIETESSKVKLKEFEDLPIGYSIVKDYKLDIRERGSAYAVSEASKMINKYGAWGSVVIDEEGNIIQNTEYAIACEILKEPLLIYKMENEKVKEYLDICRNNEFGEYFFDKLNIKAYNQLYCQMHRKKDTGANLSTLYERRVINEINKNQRIIDFGAGIFTYVNFLKDEGYNIKGYEPHFKLKKQLDIDIKKVVKMINLLEFDIKRKGLYDVVILDSVLNSITSLEFEDYVLTTCNSLLRKDGVFYCSTRDISQAKTLGSSIKTNRKNYLQYLDKNNFSVSFRDGVWTLQKFNSKEDLEKLLKKYFYEVNVKRVEGALHGVCRKPKRFELERYKKALDIEFNMEYPNNYRHNKHEKIVKEILKCLKDENR